MITPDAVRDASRTGTDLPGLPFHRLVALTSAEDWLDYVELTETAAEELADQLATVHDA